MGSTHSCKWSTCSGEPSKGGSETQGLTSASLRKPSNAKESKPSLGLATGQSRSSNIITVELGRPVQRGNYVELVHGLSNSARASIRRTPESEASVEELRVCIRRKQPSKSTGPSLLSAPSAAHNPGRGVPQLSTQHAPESPSKWSAWEPPAWHSPSSWHSPSAGHSLNFVIVSACSGPQELRTRSVHRWMHRLLEPLTQWVQNAMISSLMGTVRTPMAPRLPTLPLEIAASCQ